MGLVVQKLISLQHRRSTVNTYLKIWRLFNKFVMNLDKIPDSWEDRVILYVAHLINNGKQSSSVKSYVSAIRTLLTMDGYKWQDSSIIIAAMTRACRLINDRVKAQFPISYGFLEMILFEIERMYGDSQVYLETLFKSAFLISYYGLIRVGEITRSEHILKAKNVHMATNKDKLLIILYTSKTHGLVTDLSTSKLPQIGTKTRNSRGIKNHLSGSYLTDTFAHFIHYGSILK